MTKPSLEAQKVPSNQSVFDAYSHYYDLIYSDKDYPVEASYIQRLLTRNGIAEGDLLEFGCGTGKHGSLLAQSGYRVHGIERSKEMVSIAEVTEGFTCEQGNICAVDMGRTYDAVISLFHVVSYQTSNESVHAVFSRAADHLMAGGLFIFDFWYSPAVLSQRPTIRVKRVADEKVEVFRVAEPVIYPNRNRVDVNYTIFTRDLRSDKIEMFRETHPMRHFSLPEIEIVANIHGLRIVGAEEFLTGKAPDESTWGVCVVLRKG